MLEATTVLDWTGYYTTLKLGDECDDIPELKALLSKSGIDMVKYSTAENPYYYDTGIEEAVSEFQKEKMGISPTGIVDDATLNALIACANGMSDIVYSEDIDEFGSDSSDDDSPHFDSFFATKNEKTGRKNQVDIKIILGDNSIVKTIHNVYMRSVSVEFDTSGNPIAEVYEFIAQDLTESDEPNDTGKY